MGVFRHKDNKGSDMYNAHVQRTGTKDTMDPTSSLHDYYQEDYDTIKDYYTPLDIAPNAAAAYSLRKLRLDYDGPAIRVRRTTDNSEQDIGFNGSGQIDREALADFAQEVVVYTSDFTSGNEDLNENNGIGTDGETIGGVTDAYKFELTGGANTHQASINVLPDTKTSISFDYYIPSGQSVDEILMFTQGAVTQLSNTITDAWTTVTFTESSLVGSITFRARSGGISTVDADGDVFYLKNIVITELPDLAVTTWYDQSGNGIDAAQATASNQPLVVSGGSVILENGLPAIQSDGVNDYMESPSGILSNTTDLSTFVVFKELSDNTSNDFIWGCTDGAYGGGDNVICLRKSGAQFTFITSDGTVSETADQTRDTNQNLLSGLYTGTAVSLAKNGSISTETTTVPASVNATNEIEIFSGLNTILAANLRMQELVIYKSDQSSNRTKLESNINNYYKIY